MIKLSEELKEKVKKIIEEILDSVLLKGEIEDLSYQAYSLIHKRIEQKKKTLSNGCFA